MPDDLEPVTEPAAEPPPTRRWSRSQIGVAAVTAVLVLAAVVVLVVTLGAGDGDEVVAVDASTTTLGATSSTAPPAATAARPTTTQTVPPETVPPPPPPPPRRPLGTVVVMGDSVAASLVPGFGASAASAGIPFVGAAQSGCGVVTGVVAVDGAPFPGVETCQDAIVPHQQGLAARTGASTVVSMSTWETADRIVDGRLYRFGTGEADALLLRLLAEAKDRVLAGSDALFVVALQPPNAATSQLGPTSQDNVVRMVHLNGLLRAFAAAHPGDVRVVDMAAMVCPDGPPCPEVVDGIRPRPADGGHYSDEGAAWLAPTFFSALAAAVA